MYANLLEHVVFSSASTCKVHYYPPSILAGNKIYAKGIPNMNASTKYPMKLYELINMDSNILE